MRKLSIAFLLFACTVAAAHDGIRIMMAVQPGAPVRPASTTTGRGALLQDAELRNDSAKDVSHYRLGWAYVRGNNEIEFHTGALTRISLGRGIFRLIPGEDVAFDTRAHHVIFYVARIPSRPGASAPTKAEYICAGHPVTFIFRLRQSGGPYNSELLII